MDAAHYEQTNLWGAEHVFTPEHQLPKFEAVAALLPEGVTSIVDIGAGDGRVLHHLARVRPGSSFTAVDRSYAALLHADAALIQASVDAIPCPDRSFDAVVCCEVLEHLPPPVFDRTIGELERLATEAIIVTVPNRENRGRSEIRCDVCDCRYNADRHLRSFDDDDLHRLFSHFRVDEIIETGPHQPVYPRAARQLLEGMGLLSRPGSPSCPQCGTVYRHASAASRAEGSRNSRTGSLGVRGYRLARSLVPKARHPYYLCARFVPTA
jgi:SAM-dependent methyltransferase